LRAYRGRFRLTETPKPSLKVIRIFLMLRPPYLPLVALATALLPWTSAGAQIADVPLANANGDFLSTRLPGNRTAYPQRQWVVVERDPAGLNCRDERGQVVALLAYGAVVDSDLKGDGTEAIVVMAGRPWLRLLAHPFDLRQDLRPQAQRVHLVSCRVRANAAYLAPLNPDTLQPLGEQGGR